MVNLFKYFDQKIRIFKFLIFNFYQKMFHYPQTKTDLRSKICPQGAKCFKYTNSLFFPFLPEPLLILYFETFFGGETRRSEKTVFEKV